MDNNTREHISWILHGIDSIHDVSAGKIARLKATCIGRFALDKYKVSESEYREWRATLWEQRGAVEYDARSGHVIIRATDNLLHGAISWAMQAYLKEVVIDRLKREGEIAGVAQMMSLCTYRSIWWRFPSHRKRGRRVPGVSLRILGTDGTRYGRSIIAVEVGATESRDKLFEELFSEPDGMPCLAIVIDIKEEKPQREQPQGAGSEENQHNECVQQQPAFTWRLTNSELWEYIHTHDIDGLAHLVLDWHKEEDIPLSGTFTVRLSFCQHGQEPKEIWKGTVSHTGEANGQTVVPDHAASLSLRELMSVVFDYLGEERPLPAETERIPLPFEDMMNRMQRCVRSIEMERARNIAIQKVRELEGKFGKAKRFGTTE